MSSSLLEAFVCSCSCVNCFLLCFSSYSAEDFTTLLYSTVKVELRFSVDF